MKIAGEMTGRDRLIRHVQEYEHLVDEIYAPRELTQLGMADAMGKSRAHIANDVGHLVRMGKLETAYRVIKGSRVKQKTYVTPGHSAIRISERPLKMAELMGELRRTNARLDKIVELLSRCNLKP